MSPIRAEMRALYPPDWPLRSRLIRFVRAGSRCEWCEARNRQPHPVTGSMVVLTVAHLDHDPTNCRADNLVALCQLAHLQLDAGRKAHDRRVRSGQITAFDVPFEWRPIAGRHRAEVEAALGVDA